MAITFDELLGEIFPILYSSHHSMEALINKGHFKAVLTLHLLKWSLNFESVTWILHFKVPASDVYDDL